MIAFAAWLAGVAAAEPGVATLWVGVHRAAGSLAEIAADDTAGQCWVGSATISCPASGVVTFRWAGDGAFELSGDVDAAPGETAVAWVLAVDATLVSQRAQLAAGPTEASIRAVFVGASGKEPPPASRSLIDDLVRWTAHDDPLVRRACVDGLIPYWRRTASDPFEIDAPEILPPGLIVTLASDADWRVRRSLARSLRDIRSPGLREEALNAMMRFEADRPPVERAAIASMTSMLRAGRVPSQVAWERALETVVRPGPPGRAAANTLAFLSGELVPSSTVDPWAALDATLAHHPERAWKVWSSWRNSLPFDRVRAESLVRRTVGLNAGLIRFWAETSPDALAALLVAWEPVAPHSERFAEVYAGLGEIENEAVRTALGLSAR